MLNKKFYSWVELEELMNIQFTKKNNRAKLIRRNIEPYYEFEIIKEGRSQVGIRILEYKEKEKSSFIKLCEELANEEVSFPNEKTAERILEKLFQVDCTILDNESIGFEVGLSRQTFGSYINLFRQYKILPPKLPVTERKILDTENGEILENKLNLNKYTYYVVSRKDDYREEINKEEWMSMTKFIRDKYEEYLDEFIQVLDTGYLSKEEAKEAVEEYKSEANRFAYIDCIKENGGIPRRSLLKAPTDKAFEVLGEYFKLKTKTYI